LRVPTAIRKLFGHANIDTRKFTWLGSVTQDTDALHQLGPDADQDLGRRADKEVPRRRRRRGSRPRYLSPSSTRTCSGAKMRLVTGFGGTSQISLAMQRGEIQGACGISWTTIQAQHPDWIREKKINMLIQAAHEKDPELPDVPMASDFAKTPEQKQMLEFALVGELMARPFAAPPGIPADRKAALMAAFDATMKDPAFLAETKRLVLDVKPVTGAEIDAMVAGLYALPKDVIERATKAMTN
jgi:hypothetical protein